MICLLYTVRMADYIKCFDNRSNNHTHQVLVLVKTIAHQGDIDERLCKFIEPLEPLI